MNNTGFSKGDILVPNVENMTAWSVIACDQYTSQPQYWREVEKFVGTKPSTLNMMVPEIDFTSTDLEQHIASVNRASAPTCADICSARYTITFTPAVSFPTARSAAD